MKYREKPISVEAWQLTEIKWFVNQLGNAMEIVAPVANSLGITIEETAAALIDPGVCRLPFGGCRI